MARGLQTAFADLKLRWKFAAGFALFALIILSAYVAMFNGLSAVRETTAANNRSSAILTTATATLEALVDEQDAVRGYVATGDPGFLKRRAMFQAAYDQAVARLTAQAEDAELRARIDSLKAETARFRHEADLLVAVGRDPARRAQARAGLVTQGRLFRCRAILASIDRSIRAAVAARAAAQAIAMQSAEWALAASAAIGLLLCAALAWLMTRAIAGPIAGMTLVMRRLAGGDSDVEVPGAERADEVGDMGRAVLVFRQSARERAQLRRDAEAQRQAAEDARRKAEAANQAKSEFLATMSHEIRTPLNGVLGMVQIMAADELSPPQRERLDIVRQAGDMLLAILNDILDLSKIEAGRLELENVEFELDELVKGAHGAFAALARAKGLSFRLLLDPDVCGVYRGDPVRIRQVLNNLVSNALKFTQQGEVRIEVGRCETGLAFRVCDTGIGVAQDRIDQIFGKFVQADASTTRKFGGTGLGLSICSELCRAMGGAIRAESVLGEGSVFIVELPLEPTIEAEPEAVAGSPAEPAPSEEVVELRVLAAEDNPVNQAVLRALLAQGGAAPTFVDNGQQVLDAWAAGTWDLILMDVQMPVMDGPTAARVIRAREAELGRPPVPIIALTADALAHQIEGYRAAGMTGFVAKPIDAAELFAAISEALGSGPETVTA